MSWGKWLRRLRRSLVAAIAGWLAGVILTLPVEVLVAWRNTDGQLALAARTLGLGMIVWGIWTLIFSLIGWLLFAVPLVSILSPQWLRDHRTRVLIALSVSAILLPGKFFGLFTLHKSVRQFDSHNFFVYSIFGIGYVVVSFLVYQRIWASTAEKKLFGGASPLAS